MSTPEDTEKLKELLKYIHKIETFGDVYSKGKIAGEYKSVFKGTGIEFDRVREFDDQDDPRYIDWRVTARLGKPYVKVFHEERELNIYFLVDVSASQNFGSADRNKRDYAARFCAIIGSNALAKNDKLGLLQFTDDVESYIKPGRGKKNFLKILREILLIRPKGRRTDLNSALKFFNRVNKRTCILFLISDFLTEDFTAQLKQTIRNNNVYLVHIQDKMEEEFPDVGLLEMRDLESGNGILVDTSSAEMSASVLRKNDQSETLSELSRQYPKLHYHRFFTGSDFEKDIKRFFHRESAK